MSKTAHLTECTEWIDLEFVERERTPREIIEKGIRYHLSGLSILNTVTLLEDLGVKRSRTAVHNWVQKADLQPAGGTSPDRVALDQKAIRINDEGYWLYTAVDPETNRILHTRLFPTYTIPICREFIIDAAADLIGGLRREGYSYRVEIHGKRNQFECIFREVQQRTPSFSNCFSHVDPPTAETWLQAHAVRGIMLNLIPRRTDHSYSLVGCRLQSTLR